MELAWSRGMRRQAGFTLLEMMIVVAIIGILAGVAVYAYQRVTSNAKVESEVNAIFAELRIRQEEYHTENGVYLSTGASEASTFPPGAPVAAGDAPIDIAPLLSAADGNGGTPADAWVNLRMRPTKTDLRCAYVSIAGPADTGPSGGAAVSIFNSTGTFQTNWYYLLAECDSDGQSGTNAMYFARFDREDVAVVNKGK